jgi:hypothetical protein
MVVVCPVFRLMAEADPDRVFVVYSVWVRSLRARP